MGFPTLDITAPDADKEVLCPGCNRLSVQVSNQAVYITFGAGTPMAIYEPAEVFLPVIGNVLRNFDAFKVRAYTPAASLPAGATQARVQLRPIPIGQ
jgi:hypothetical protein